MVSTDFDAPSLPSNRQTDDIYEYTMHAIDTQEFLGFGVHRGPCPHITCIVLFIYGICIAC